jgi:hypothetical protein
VILISSHSVGDDIKSHIAELLKDNILEIRGLAENSFVLLLNIMKIWLDCDLTR